MSLPRPKLSYRMALFLEHALDGMPFWDVCCDHGYVGVRAINSGRFTEIHFVDQIPHIMDRLEVLISLNPNLHPDCPYFLHSLPGERIERNVEGTLLIAGVGGVTIKKILEGLFKNEFLKAKRLLLSPHVDMKVLLEYLESPNFSTVYIQKERILIPEGKRERPLYILDLH